jgi:hypothetical protein
MVAGVGMQSSGAIIKLRLCPEVAVNEKFGLSVIEVLLKYPPAAGVPVIGEVTYVCAFATMHHSSAMASITLNLFLVIAI